MPSRGQMLPCGASAPQAPGTRPDTHAAHPREDLSARDGLLNTPADDVSN